MQTSDSPWLEAAPDIPRFVEVRSILLTADGRVVGRPDAGFAVDVTGDLAGMMGRPGPQALEEALAILKPNADILATSEDVGHLAHLLPDHRPRRAVLHLCPGPPSRPGDLKVEISEVDHDFLDSLPSHFREDVMGAHLAAVSRVDGTVASVCGAFSLTETLWDVGIDTLPGYQRQGHATRCYIALEACMSEQGRRPVWGAYEDNAASLGMAASLGFEPVDELWVVEL